MLIPQNDQPRLCLPVTAGPLELTHLVEPKRKAHVPVEEHHESFVPQRQRGRPHDTQLAKSWNTGVHCQVYQAAMDATTDMWSSASRNAFH